MAHLFKKIGAKKLSVKFSLKVFWGKNLFGNDKYFSEAKKSNFLQIEGEGS